MTRATTMKISVIYLLSVLSTACSYHILCFQGLPSRSHYNLMKGIATALVDAGHEVTMVTTYPDKTPTKNLRMIGTPELLKILDEVDLSNQESTTMSLSKLKELSDTVTRTVLGTPAVRDVLLNGKFDAVVTEWFFSDVEAGYAAVLQVPWIVLAGSLISPVVEDIVDTARSVSTIPMMFNLVPIPMNFWQRLINTFMYSAVTIGSILDYPKIEAAYHELYGPLAEARGVQLPPFKNAVHNVSVLFVNSHNSFAPAQSLPPNVVEIGGYHIDEKIPPLPKDLQDLLDSSKQGVIYFSLGSVVKSKTLPKKTVQDLVKLFGQFPQTVLWKFEEEIENPPKNLHVRSWMPQPSILSHPNVKVFITHGGLLSTTESLYFGLPLLAIPLFGDQPGNALRSVWEGRALKVDLSPDMAGELGVALRELLTNDTYSKQAKRMSKLFRNRLVSPKKVIPHYVEMAIETQGAYHLRSKLHQYKWYEVWMLDQIAFILVLLYVIFKLIRKIVKVLIRKIVKGKKQKRN